MTKPYSSHRFIANCFIARNFKKDVEFFPISLFISSSFRALIFHSFSCVFVRLHILQNASKIAESSTGNMKGWMKWKKHGIEFDPKRRNSALRRQIAKDRKKARAYIPPLHFFV
nr:hypothetical protein [Tanacetum cinerariifolium]